MKKLVRDNIPDIIKSKGENAKYFICSPKEYPKYLSAKLHEEVDELISAISSQEPIEKIMDELSDVEEVLNAICDFHQIDPKKLEQTRVNKANLKGKFDKKIILVQE